jgi:4-amino-4-deoxy-L-arabinose transferase-like glycosyltransferase
MRGHALGLSALVCAAAPPLTSLPSVMMPRFLGLTPAAATAWLILVLTVLRFFLAVWLPLTPDEAYYWQWSRHLDASYFSKGPAVAYTIWAGTKLLGDTVLGIRFFAVLLSAGTAWQIFLLARRWYDDVSGLIAVLLLSVVPLYAVGALLMTIDPLSVFFWVWAANCFSDAVRRGRLRDWAWTGFALGCGFLAKYVNALELLAFALFLAVLPRHRPALGRPGFWTMLAVALFCTLPVWWWNARHHWTSAGQLVRRGGLDERFTLHAGTLADFLVMQAVMISPLLFIALLGTAALILWKGSRCGGVTEGELFFVLLFLSVFLFYAVIALHLRSEPNWPAVSYLGLIVALAAHTKAILDRPPARGRGFLVALYLVAWLESVTLYYMRVLPVPPNLNPTSRLLGWQEIAGHMETLQMREHADVLIGDGYKEASILSFYLPGHTVYAKRYTPPATQYDFWPPYPTAAPHRALWVTGHATPVALAAEFGSIRLVERFEILDAGHVLRRYAVYLCENR